MHLYHPVCTGACGGQKRVSDFLQLDLGMFVSLIVDGGFLMKGFRGNIQRTFKRGVSGNSKVSKIGVMVVKTVCTRKCNQVVGGVGSGSEWKALSAAVKVNP